MGLPQPEIPDLPGLPSRQAANRAEVELGAASGSIRVGGRAELPIRIEPAAGLQAIDLTIACDTTVLDLTDADIRLGELLTQAPVAWTLMANVDDVAGLVRVTLFTTVPLAGGTGDLLQLNWQVRADAGAGISTEIRLDGELNEGRVDLLPVKSQVTTTRNRAPVAVADAYALAEDSDFLGATVLANDADPDQDVLTAAQLSPPSHGTLALAADGTFRYRPDSDFAGSDSFSYKASDGLAESDAATVTLTVLGVNDPPQAVADTVTVTENSRDNLFRVLDNDSSGPEPGETLQVLAVTPPGHGTAAVTEDGLAVTYSPDPGYSGPDAFAYTVSDGNGGTAQAAVNVTVRFALHLEPGWNVVSCPVVPELADFATVFAGVPVTTVWEWSWEGYRAAARLTPKRGYWLFLDRAGAVDVPVSGPVCPDAQVTLGLGWDLLGPVAEAAVPADPHLGGEVWAWNAHEQAYEALPPGALLRPGHAYWVYSSSDHVVW